MWRCKHGKPTQQNRSTKSCSEAWKRGLAPKLLWSIWQNAHTSFTPSCTPSPPPPPKNKIKSDKIILVCKMWDKGNRNPLNKSRIVPHFHWPIAAVVVPPGVPKVESAGPLLPALDTKTTPCLFTTSLRMSHTRLETPGERRYTHTHILCQSNCTISSRVATLHNIHIPIQKHAKQSSKTGRTPCRI